MSSVDGKGSVMNCNAEIETNRNALKRLMALLLALADLADCAAGRSWPVRRLVLSILGLAEQAAHAFVTRSADTRHFRSAPSASAMPTPRGSSPIDAMQLALSFRMLALAVCAMLANARPSSRPERDHVAAARPAGRAWQLPADLPRERQVAFAEWPDTS